MNKMTRGGVIALVVSFLAGLIIGVCVGGGPIEEGRTEVRTHIDTVTVTDTITYYKPIPIDSVVVRHRVVTDTIRINVGGCDTVVVADYDIPVVQKEYRDTAYHAWVSGYEPVLDSIHVFPRTLRITKTVTRTEHRDRRWGVGLSTGMGYCAGELQPYIGVGVQYNILSW